MGEGYIFFLVLLTPSDNKYLLVNMCKYENLTQDKHLLSEENSQDIPIRKNAYYNTIPLYILNFLNKEYICMYVQKKICMYSPRSYFYEEEWEWF